MEKCCEGKTTPFCANCGSPIQGYPLIEIKVYFESRLKRATERLKARKDEAQADKQPVGRSAAGLQENVAKAQTIVDRWSRWIGLIKDAMQVTPTE